MNAQCSPEPYRLTADGRLEKSGLYHQMKSFKTKPIEDIITSLMEKGVLPTIKDYNNITFRSEGRLQVTFLKEEINDDVFLIFDVDGFQFEEDDPVGLLAVDYNLRYSITDVVSLMFD